MEDLIKIGTRESKLAVWQAIQVRDYLNAQQLPNELIYIKSEGDINLTTPLYDLGVQGIFTKTLDIALLESRIDIAVHSHKDVPTQLAKGLQIAAVLKRGNPFDVLVCKDELQITNYELRNSNTSNPLTIHDSQFTIATSSTRRKAQWLHRHPNYTIENLRGNVITRIQKVKESNWQGAIFAAAGLERLGLSDIETGPQILLDWMLPAPAQGAVVIVCRKDDEKMLGICAALNDEPTQICTKIERDFLKLLQGGCSTPIGAFAEIVGDEIIFRGNVTAVDGSKSISVELKEKLQNAFSVASKASAEMVAKGGRKLLA